MVAAELLYRPRFIEHGRYVGNRAAHPFQSAIGEALSGQCGAHLVIGKNRTVVALGRLIQFYAEVLDGGALAML